MATNFISSNSISTTLRISASKSQVAMSKAIKEATTGRLADVGEGLGALAGRDVTLRAELLDMGKLVDTNALVGARLDVAQERISQLIDTAQSFQKDLLAARNSANPRSRLPSRISISPSSMCVTTPRMATAVLLPKNSSWGTSLTRSR